MGAITFPLRTAGKQIGRIVLAISFVGITGSRFDD